MTYTEEQAAYDEESARIDAIVLPEWVTLPPEKKLHTLTAAEEYGRWVVKDDQLPDATFNNPVAAYDTLSKAERDPDILFDESLTREEWGEVCMGDSYLAKDRRFLPNVNRATKVMLIKWAYSHAMEAEATYLADTTDWVSAYRYLLLHPMFWRRRNGDKGETGYNDWITDSGLSQMWTYVSKLDDGSPVVLLEHGPAYEPRVATSHDHYLDATGKDFGEAYVKFAANVHKYYNLDGSDKEPRLPL